MLGTVLIGLVTFLTAVFTYYGYHFWFSRAAKFIRTLPGPPKLFYFGNLFDLNVPNEELTRKANFEFPRKYGPRYTISISNRHYFTSTQGKDIERLLSSSTHLGKGIEYKFVMPWLGEGLLTSQGQKWFSHRKLLTPSFHFKILEEFMDVYNEQANIFVDILRKDSEGGKNALEISMYVARCTLDIICETAMGKRINAQSEKNSPYVTAIYEYVLVKLLAPNSLHHPMVIQERKKELIKQKQDGKLDQTQTYEKDENDVFMNKKKRAVAFMDLLLGIQSENPAAMTDREIREETDTFMFEGHDTTATSLSFTIFLLGCYPEVQKKAFAEMEEIFGEDKCRTVTSQDLTKMKYLECVIKESLRLFPSVPFIARDLREDLILDDGVVVPKGFNYSVFPMAIHRDPEAWPNPEEFNPERFFPENSVGRHPYSYVPFSAGPRNCIGQKFAQMEEKVVLSQLLRNFRLESVETRDEIILTTEVILRSKNGLHVKFIPR